MPGTASDPDGDSGDGGGEEEGDESPAVERAPMLPRPVTLVANPLLRLGLRLPVVHRLVSDTLSLLTVTGHRSGTEYTFPVAYERHDGAVYVTTHGTNWWRNVAAGEREVVVHLEGDRRAGTATVLDDEAATEYLQAYLERNGTDAAALRAGLKVSGDEVPDRDALAAGGDHVVVVRIDLD